VENELEARREAACQSPGIPAPDPRRTRQSAALLRIQTATVPIRDDFVVAVDQPEVDQHLSVAGHRQVREHAAHQAIPIGDAARGVVALVAVGRRGEAQAAVTLHQRSDHARSVASPQIRRCEPMAQTSPGRDTATTGHPARRLRVGSSASGSDISASDRTSRPRSRHPRSRSAQVVPRLGQLGQLQRQHLLVPARVERQPVVGDDQARFCATVRWASSITGT
jgi:hypothetical protein